MLENPSTDPINSLSKPLVLRVTNRANRISEEVQINQEKCLLGSGELADVHIPEPNIKEIHCEFVRNPVGIYVRQFGDEILINGLSLTEAWVFPGDKIQIANFDIEILEVGQFVLEAVTNVKKDLPAKSNQQQVAVTVNASNSGFADRDHGPGIDGDQAADPQGFPGRDGLPPDGINPDTDSGKPVAEQLDGADQGADPKQVTVNADPERAVRLLDEIDKAVSEVAAQLQPSGQSPEAEPKPENKRFESVADVVSRMQKAGKLDSVPIGTEAADNPPSHDAEAQEPEADVDVGEEEEAPAKGGDESVQDYMNQLMQRLRTSGEEDKKQADDSIDAQVGMDAEDAQDEEEEDLTPENPLRPSEFVPNQVAPEKITTLDALRQVANQAAYSAIKRSARERNSETNSIYLGAATVCLFISTVLFMFSTSVLDIPFILAMFFAVGCVGWSLRYLSVNLVPGKSQKHRTKTQRTKAQRSQAKG